MRDFFISSFEKLVSVIVVLMCIAVVIGAIAAFTQPEGGVWQGILVLIAGGLYTVMVGGMFYVMLGIYHNTRRTAIASEKLVEKT